jgi:DNA topoisomerase IB
MQSILDEPVYSPRGDVTAIENPEEFFLRLPTTYRSYALRAYPIDDGSADAAEKALKRDVTGEARDQTGEWTSGGASTKPSVTGTPRVPKPPTSKPSKKPNAPKIDEDDEESGGRFAKPPTQRGEMVYAKRVGTGKNVKIVLSDGSTAPEHMQKLAGSIPPDWSEVKIAKDPSMDVLVTARDPNGNSKLVYNDAYEKRNEAIKFVRAADMVANHDVILKEFAEDRLKSETREQADCARLMLAQATRPGSESDNKGVSKYFGKSLTPDDVVLTKSDNPKIAIIGKQTDAQKKAAASGKDVVAINVNGSLVVIKDKKTKAELLKRANEGGDLHDSTYWLKSHGATTLEGRHVVEAPDGTRLKFVGKEGVFHDHLVKDPEVAKMLLERKAKSGDTGQLFNTNEIKLRDYVKTKDGGDFLSKDLRTARANMIAIDEINKIPAPKTDKEYKAKRDLVGQRVAHVLGNEIAQSLKSYISPELFSDWRINAGVQG